MIQSKKIFSLISILILIIVLTIFVFLNSFVYAEGLDDSSLKIESTRNINGDNIKTIKNIQKYLNKNRKALLEKEKNVLDAIEYNGTNEDVIQNILNSDTISVASVTYDEIVDSGTSSSSNPLVIYTMLCRDSSKDKNGKKAYYIYCQATWSSSPTYRLKDILAITCTNNITYGSTSERTGTFSYEQHFSSSVTEYNYSIANSNSVIQEHSSGTNYGVLVDLPNDTIASNTSIRCLHMVTTISIYVYANDDFNVYSAYGHKYIGGSAQITSAGAVNITFNNACTNYSGIMLSSI